jgi:cobaltochelatase CobT subunit
MIDLNQNEINERTAEIAKTTSGEESAVSFLVDNSGSMRGIKILNVACSASIATSVLSNANVQCEVLGFTTRAWKGGSSRELWIKDGKPAHPGRLNDLRHIIYKDFNETMQEADTNFGLMLTEGLLKENVDGEALLWASWRLRHHRAKRKLLFVISDGAPVDDSTLSVNPGNFLDLHLRATIGEIQAAGEIELYGVGIGYDVSRYYGSKSPILDGSNIGADLLRVVTFAMRDRWDEAQKIQRSTEPEVLAAGQLKRSKSYG